MALRQTIQAFSKLGIQGVGSTKCASTLNGNQCLASLMGPRSLLHTSFICQRNLDSRRVPPNKEPSKRTGRWEPRKKMTEMYEYTTEPLPFPRTGGRGPNGLDQTKRIFSEGRNVVWGHIWNHKRGGGDKKVFYMIDWVRGGPSKEGYLIEKVEKIQTDQNRSGHIALVAAGEKKRWIVATQNMKTGDLVKSTQQITKTAVRASEGDAYPLGSLPIGTLVSCVEMYPGKGGMFARSAGVTAQLLRKLEDTCIVRLPSKREVCLSSQCTATVGRVSNVDHNKRVLGKAGAKRWLGIRPRSGRWHRKTGRFGRKIRPVKPMKVYDIDKPQPARQEVFRHTV